MSTIQTFFLLSVCGVALASGLAAQTRFETLESVTGTMPGWMAIADGMLYGATYSEALPAGSCGTIFDLQPPPGGTSWTQTTLYNFPQTTGDACFPVSPPLATASGALYGITPYGGDYNDGAFYELQPPTAPGGAWTASVLYSFDLDGGTGLPAALAPGPDGSFYCSASGGPDIFGAILQFQPPTAPGGAWTATVIYNFADFLGPRALVPGPDGTLYGAAGYGQIIQLSPPVSPGGAWTLDVLYTVSGHDGLGPNSLVLAQDGTLYGTTVGSTYALGVGNATVFQLTPPGSPGASWGFKVLQNFGEFLNLNSPLILRDGNLYSTVSSVILAGNGRAAQTGAGQIFELQAPATAGGDWTLVHLHDFTGDQLPGGALAMDKDGDIFGVTATPYNQPPAGTVYRLATK
jgi:hypothetical protein